MINYFFFYLKCFTCDSHLGFNRMLDANVAKQLVVKLTLLKRIRFI